MATRFTLPGMDWDELLAMHQRNVEALEEANRLAFKDAQAEIETMLGEASRLIDGCRQFEQKSRAFEESMARLGRANEALKTEVDTLPDGFLAALSHKLVSPFTSICSFSEILSDHPQLPLDRRNGFLVIAIKESERLTRAIDRIVELSRLRSGRATPEVVDVFLHQAIEDAVAETRSLFEGKAVALEVTLADGLPPLRADRVWLARVVENLLANAARFAEAGKGRVALSARAADGAVEISVSDDGPGIAPERHKIIFAQFLEANDTLDDEPRGIGLGLALSKEIVERLGGRIRVESAPGAGARFSFTVPSGGNVQQS